MLDTTAEPGRASETETRLCALFAAALDLPEVGVDDNFFLMGGNSLLATKLVSRIRTDLGVELPLRTFFETPTVAGLAQRVQAALPARPALAAAERPKRIPLSFAQRRLWFINQMEGPSATYNIPFALQLTGTVDIPALRAALTDVTARHETLRTIFPDEDGVPYQLVLEPDPASVLTVVDTKYADLDQALRTAAHRGFDLTAERPMRAELHVLGSDRCVLLVLMHHIAGDGWSMAPLSRDLSHAYARRRVGEAPQWQPLPVQYADYTLWQQRLLDEDTPGSEAAAQRAYWRKALDGLPDQLVLPTDRPRPAVAGHEGATIRFTLSAELQRRLTEIAAESDASLFMVLQASVSALLTRLGAGTDIPLGTPVAGRTDEALDDLVGFFVNTLVLRTDTSGDPTFRNLLKRARETALGGFAHQDMPFESLVELLNPDRSLARHPLFQIMLVLQNNAETTFDLPGLTAESVDLVGRVAGFDLTFGFREKHGPGGEPEGIDGFLEYRTDLFDPATAERIADSLRLFVEAVAADPDRRIGEAEILSPVDRHRLLSQWTGAPAPTPPAFFTELFEHKAALHPKAPAVEHEGTSVTYGELNARANRVARWLIRHGAGPERFVALAVPRSADMVVALLGVLKAGAAFLPVDPEYPQDRIAFMLDDARPRCVLTTRAAARLLPSGGPPLLLLDSPDSLTGLATFDSHDVEDAERLVPRAISDPAYLIYTSGSTGTPKGVVVTHEGIHALAATVLDRCGVREHDRVLQLASISFDAAFEDFLRALCSGATLVVPPPGRSRR